MRWGCWRAQAGVRHKDGRRAAPTERRETRAVAAPLSESRPVQLAASHLLRAKATVSCSKGAPGDEV
jgi:hypothetical protein